MYNNTNNVLDALSSYVKYIIFVQQCDSIHDI
jgi:hypothetical protein